MSPPLGERMASLEATVRAGVDAQRDVLARFEASVRERVNAVEQAAKDDTNTVRQEVRDVRRNLRSLVMVIVGALGSGGVGLVFTHIR